MRRIQSVHNSCTHNQHFGRCYTHIQPSYSTITCSYSNENSCRVMMRKHELTNTRRTWTMLTRHPPDSNIPLSVCFWDPARIPNRSSNSSEKVESKTTIARISRLKSIQLCAQLIVHAVKESYVHNATPERQPMDVHRQRHARRNGTGPRYIFQSGERARSIATLSFLFWSSHPKFPKTRAGPSHWELSQTWHCQHLTVPSAHSRDQCSGRHPWCDNWIRLYSIAGSKKNPHGTRRFARSEMQRNSMYLVDLKKLTLTHCSISWPQLRLSRMKRNMYNNTPSA